MGWIDWLPFSDLPEQLKDGRDILFWVDGQALVGQWDRFLDGDDEWYFDWATREGVRLVGATHFAEVNGPT